MGSIFYTFLVIVVTVILQWVIPLPNLGLCFAVCMLGGAILYSINKLREETREKDGVQKEKEKE